MPYAVDASNYTRTPSGGLRAEDVARLRDQADVRAWLVQAVNPAPPYPPGVTAQQCQAVLDAGGVALHVYYFWWLGVGVDYLKRLQDLVAPFAGRVARAWVDAEDTTGGVPQRLALPLPPQAARWRFERQARPAVRPLLRAGGTSAQQRIDELLAWHAEADTFPAVLGPSGQYGAAWYHGPYLGGTDVFAAAGHPLWGAQYDDVPDRAVFGTFGGWPTPPAIKQYAGTSALLDVTGIDLNVAADAECAVAGEEPPMPPDAPDAPGQPVDQGWLDKKPVVVQTAGELQAVAAQLRSEADRKAGVRKTEIRRLAADVQARADLILR